VTADSIQVIPGWYGKLPSLGDFASRRLEGDFIPVWDAWLQEVLQATRNTSSEGWLDSYLTMPIWRFVLLPGLIGSNGWAGVLMPSVDRVGRQFPLTLVAALSSYAAVAQAVFHGAEWFEGLEETALGVLDPTRGPEDLDQSLVDRGFAAPQTANLTAPDGSTLRRLSSVDEGFELLAQTEALRAWGRDVGWSGLWWTRGRVDGDPLMLTCAALPTAEEFGWLLQSRLSPAGRDDTNPSAYT
jgi:type VI secretion system protein ImpM